MVAYLPPGATVLWIAGGAAVTAVALGFALWWWRRRQRGPEGAPSGEPLVRVDQLRQDGPPPAGPRLTVHHVPVRLSALVLAPLGRRSRLPPPAELGRLVDQLVPGFQKVVDAHQPAFARWPAQLSIRGFVRTFFREVALPGNRGSGTPWCSLAGRFDAEGKGYLIGMVCRGDAANSLGELEITSSSQWLDIVRVRDEDR